MLLLRKYEIMILLTEEFNDNELKTWVFNYAKTLRKFSVCDIENLREHDAGNRMAVGDAMVIVILAVGKDPEPVLAFKNEIDGPFQLLPVGAVTRLVASGNKSHHGQRCESWLSRQGCRIK